MLGRIVIAASIIMSLLIYQNLSAAPTSFSGIEDYDWYTRDTVHDLDFLDVNTFTNYSWNNLQGGMDYMGRHWRLASVDEVAAIWNLAQPLAPDGVGSYSAPNVNDPAIPLLVGLFSATSTPAAAWQFTSGWTSTQASSLPLEYYTALLWDYNFSIGAGTDLYRTSGTWSPWENDNSVGAWLVAPAPVPPSRCIMATQLRSYRYCWCKEEV